MTKYFIIILTLVVIGRTSLSGQQNTIIGRVVNETSHKPVEFAHIENYSTHINTISDTSGFFTLRAKKGDTLVLSAIGYYYKLAVVSDSMFGLSTFSIFPLTQRIYELAEANIYMPRTYSQFKHDFIELDFVETDTDVLRNDLADIARIEGKKAYDRAMEERMLDGVTIARIPILTRNEKDRLRLKETIEKEEIQNLIYAKYNPEIVRQVTGLSDEDEIIAFMQFCDFKDDYLLEVNQIDLMEYIAAKYIEYQMKKKG